MGPGWRMVVQKGALGSEDIGTGAAAEVLVAAGAEAAAMEAGAEAAGAGGDSDENQVHSVQISMVISVLYHMVNLM